MFFNIVKDLFKSIGRLRRSGKGQLGFKAETNDRSRWSEIEVLNTLSDFALKIRSFIQFNKVFFNKVKDLFKSIGRLRRSGKVEMDSKEEGIIVLGGLR